MMRAAIAAVLIAGAAALVSPSAASAQEGPPAVFVMNARSNLGVTGRLPWGCTLTPIGALDRRQVWRHQTRVPGLALDPGRGTRGPADLRAFEPQID
jgi:hypothetical protein